MAIKDNNKTAVTECMLLNISKKHWDDDSNVRHSAIDKDGSVFLLSMLGFFLCVYCLYPRQELSCQQISPGAMTNFCTCKIFSKYNHTNLFIFRKKSSMKTANEFCSFVGLPLVLRNVLTSLSLELFNWTAFITMERRWGERVDTYTEYIELHHHKEIT